MQALEPPGGVRTAYWASHLGTRWNRWVGIELAETALAHHAEHSIVEKTVGRDESRVSQEMAAGREIKW